MMDKKYTNLATHIAHGGEALWAKVTDHIEDYEVVEVCENEVRVILYDADERNDFGSHWLCADALNLILT